MKVFSLISVALVLALQTSKGENKTAKNILKQNIFKQDRTGSRALNCKKINTSYVKTSRGK